MDNDQGPVTNRDESPKQSPDAASNGSGELGTREEPTAGTDEQEDARGQGLSVEESISEEAFESALPDIPFPSITVNVDNEADEQQTPALPYPVVGFGASAGGLQAFKEILENLDPKTGMAFVLVTHLAPDQKSFLSEIVERYTQMPVQSIESGLRPLPNHLYVLLPNQTVTLHRGLLQVEPRPLTDRVPRTIDTFFRSLGADQKNHAIGVVLSGADADGALGLKTIKGEGGIAIVQSPESAAHGDMPRSSIAADHVDLIIRPAEIALELGRLATQYTMPGLRALEDAAVAPDEDQSLKKIVQLLRSVSGIDLRQYKPDTVRRRIARRMLLLRMEHLSDYLRFLQMRGEELRTLQDDVLINVTRFFRDRGFWEALRAQVLPVLVQDRPSNKPIRVWCAGCSTGEEAYSLVISLLEYLSQNGLETPIQIFGTDASERAIETARAAIYPETALSEMSPERVRRYFVKVEAGYQLSKRVRDACIFARQNVAGDPPFSHIDVLSCRNVMIYFTEALQRQVILTFHYALEPGGYLLLGTSEGLRDYGDVFNTVDRRFKIYMKTGAKLPFNYAPMRSSGLALAGQGTRMPAAGGESPIWPEANLQRSADRIVLSRFGPPGLIIDERMNVLQSRGQSSQFLDITPGTVSWNLLRVLRIGIANDATKAAQRAILENVPTTEVAITMDDHGVEQAVQIDVFPITSALAHPRCFLVLFQVLHPAGANHAMEQSIHSSLSADEKDRLIGQLRQELSSTRFHLQSLLEERDTRNQELVSANEEIQSANEELQSTNEELETTKEELQSANEELQTLNDELQQRNNVLTQTGNDLTNLLNSVSIPLLMLTSDLHIRQFTPPMQRLLNVRSTDIGRPISEIRLQLSLENIEPILMEVMETLGTREIEVTDREGRWHLLRVRPYRTAENKIDGIVVVLMDIDQLRRSQQNMLDARDFANSVVEGVPVPIVVLNENFSIRSVNNSFRALTGLGTAELESRSLPALMDELWGARDLAKRLAALLNSAPGTSIELEHRPTESFGGTILLIKAQVLLTDGRRVILLIVEDITLRRNAELLMGRQKEALEGEIQLVERTLNRTQEELRGLTAHLFTVQEEERQRVARELHDDISQRLSVLEILLHEINTTSCSTEDVGRIEDACAQIESLSNDVRHISHRLHPAILHDLGLPAALRSMVQEFSKREDMPATYTSHDLPDAWSTETATAIYRIAQEALRNVSKHAGKTHVKVVLTGMEGQLQLRVMDFGMGFDQDGETSRGLGMISMKERARLAGGALAVESALGNGTTVTATVPLEHHA